MISVSGSGTLNHEFKISESGTYTAFVETNKGIRFSGVLICFRGTYVPLNISITTIKIVKRGDKYENIRTI